MPGVLILRGSRGEPDERLRDPATGMLRRYALSDFCPRCGAFLSGGPLCFDQLIEGVR